MRRPPSEGENEAPDEAPVNVSEIDTLGQLSAEELVPVRRILDRLCTSRRKRADAKNEAAAESDPQSLYDAAHAIYQAVAGEVALVALEAGLYYVQDGPSTMPKVEGVYYMSFDAKKDGEPVSLTLAIPHSDYPELASAHEYRETMNRYLLQTICDEFNRKDHGYRAAAIESHLKKRTGADRPFKEYFRRGITIDHELALLRVHQ